MLQYVVGPAAEQAISSFVQQRHTQLESCPASQPSITRETPPTDNPSAVSYPDVRLETSGETSTDCPDHEVTPPTVVVDRIPVADAVVVPKKRGRKPKRRRRLAAASAPNHPTQDTTVKVDTSTHVEAILQSGQSSNSVQQDVAASKPPDEQRPAPKKRGRKPKPRPEVAVVSDVTESGRSPLAESPRRNTGPTAGKTVNSEVAAATTTESAGHDSFVALSTSGGNGNAGVADGGSQDATPPRRRGRKRKDATSEKDDQRQAKIHADEGRVQSVWKVTSPASPDCAGNVVPRIKVTNVRLSSGSTAGESGDACNVEVGVQAATTSGSETVGRNSDGGGRQGTLMAKSWKPVARRRGVIDEKTMVPVLDRAREWIHATPKPSRDDWTGPVFPARELVGVGNADGGTKESLPTRDSTCPLPAVSPAKSGSLGAVGSQRQHLAPVDGAVGGLVVFPGDMVKTGGVRGQNLQSSAVAVDVASELMYVIGGRECHGPPAVRPQNREHSLTVHPGAGRPVGMEGVAVPSLCSTFDRQLSTPAVCSFANDRRTGQYMAKRVGPLINLPAVFRFLSRIYFCVNIPLRLLVFYQAMQRLEMQMFGKNVTENGQQS